MVKKKCKIEDSSDKIIKDNYNYLVKQRDNLIDLKKNLEDKLAETKQALFRIEGAKAILQKVFEEQGKSLTEERPNGK